MSHILRHDIGLNESKLAVLVLWSEGSNLEIGWAIEFVVKLCFIDVVGYVEDWVVVGRILVINEYNIVSLFGN